MRSRIWLNFICISAFAAPAFASKPMPKIAPRLVELSVAKVGDAGKIIKRETAGTFETLLISIPVEVRFPDACTDFAGQETMILTMRHGLVAPSVALNVKGLQDPQDNPCVAVMVPAQSVELTVPIKYSLEMSVSTVGKLVRIGKAGTFKVTVDFITNDVRIAKVKP